MPQKKQYGTQVTAEAREGKAFIRIVDTISEYGMASSSEIRNQVDVFIAAGIKEAKVYLTSRGGDVFQSTDIGNELSRFETVDITVGALAASAATYLVARFRTTAKPNSQFMLHRPRMGTYGDLVQINADLKLLENTTADYKATYAKKMGKTEEEIEALWEKGDLWLTAKEALAYGLIDAIEETEDLNISAQDAALLEACGAPQIPTVRNETPSNNKMEKLQLIALLGLSADATDEQIEAAIKKNKQEAEAAANLQASAENEKKVKVTALVDSAIADKKITAEQKGHYEKLATADYESTKAVLTAMQPIPKLSAELGGTGTGASSDASRKDWTLEDYLDKDVNAYEEMKTSDPEKAKRLEAAYFGK